MMPENKTRYMNFLTSLYPNIQAVSQISYIRNEMYRETRDYERDIDNFVRHETVEKETIPSFIKHCARALSVHT